MKREAKYLFTKAIDALVLTVEHFNRPSDRGRADTVLILLDHGFEMLLKAAILHRGGKIRKPRERNTFTFKQCLRKALSEGGIQFLTEEQVLQLQALNSLRDAAQHHLLDLSEQHLYIHVQAGLTIFRDILGEVFDEELKMHLPTRVLPLSTTPPTEIATVFQEETREIERLLRPGRRRRLEANAKLRGLAIVDSAMLGENDQPTDSELKERGVDIGSGKEWHELFPGVAAIQFTATGTGPSLDLRISKSGGIPTQLVPEGTPGASVVAVRRVDTLGFYNLAHTQLKEHLRLTGPKTTALIWHLDIKDDPDCFNRVTIGKSSFNRYSQEALRQMREALKTINIDDVWTAYRNR